MSFKCYICGFVVGRRFNLNRHIESQHLPSNKLSNHTAESNEYCATATSGNLLQTNRLKQLCRDMLNEYSPIRANKARSHIAPQGSKAVQLGSGLKMQNEASESDASNENASDTYYSMTEEEAQLYSQSNTNRSWGNGRKAAVIHLASITFGICQHKTTNFENLL